MSEDIAKSDAQNEVISVAEDAIGEAETLDDLVDILLDESQEPQGDSGDGVAGEEDASVTVGEGVVEDDASEEDDFDPDSEPEKVTEFSLREDPEDMGRNSSFGAVGHDEDIHFAGGRRDYFSDGDDEDMLVSMPQDTTVITQGTVTMLDTEAHDKTRHSGKTIGEDRYKVSMGATFASLFVGLALGIVGTFLVMNGTSKANTSSMDDTVTLPAKVQESQLSTEMVSYEYDGQTYSLSIQNVIEETGSLESMRTDDMYSVPSAEKALEAVRDSVILAEAEKHGISITDGDVLDYVAGSYGLATVDELAEQVGLDVDETERQLRDRLVIKRLKSEITGFQELLPLVEPPAPDDGDPSAMTDRYGEYIRSLAGDEWNSTDNAWANPDGIFAQAFAESMFDGHVASYDMAKTAYDVVHRRNEEIRANIDSAWSDYLNDLFRKVHVTVATVSR